MNLNPKHWLASVFALGGLAALVLHSPLGSGNEAPAKQPKSIRATAHRKLNPQPTPEDIVVDVAIIGGGVAGLSAAKVLEEGGAPDWVILEGQGRLGGRARTLETYITGLSANIDIGVKWVQGLNRNPFWDWIQHCQVDSDFVNYVNTYVYDTSDGTTGLDAQLGEPSLRWNDFDKGWTCIQDEGDFLNSLYDETGEVADPIPNGREVFTSCGWIPESPADRAIEWYDQEYEYGYKADRMSIYAYPEYTYVDFQSKERIITDDEGVEKFVKCLAESFISFDDERIRFNTEVTKILTESKKCPEELNDDCVEMHLDGGQRVFANHAISTIPFGVLKANHKTLLPQGFPGEDVLDKFAMAQLCKTFLEFKFRFWDDDAEFILSTKDATGDEFNPIIVYKPYDTGHPNWYKPGSLILHAVIAGDDAIAYEQLSDEEAKELHLTRLQELYPGAFVEDDLKAMFVARWSLWPWAYGAWPQYLTGASPADFEELSKPVGQLMFSGDHTCKRYYGFVHGAMIAGFRDGQRALEKLGLDFVAENRCEELPPNQGFAAPKSKYFKG